jgi:hypothetical protein
MKRPELAITIILRVLGCAAVCAIPAIFLPYSWMDAIHGYLGLGTLPDTPIVSYLARSLSMFYAMFGTISLFASSDVRRHKQLVTLLAAMSIMVGVTLFGIDFVSGMPTHWTVVEGPFTIIVGVAILWLQRQARDLT